MEHTPMPEPMRRAVNQLVYEAVERCQEVMSYAASDVARDWKRMTLYRATDAADTMNCVAMLIAAYCEHVGVEPETQRGYLQISQQRNRADGPEDHDRAQVAGLLNEAAPGGGDEMGAVRTMFDRGQRQAEQAQQPEDRPEVLFTMACLHGLRAKLCDDLGSLDRFPPEVAAMARRVAGALDMPELVTT
ncbi:hypothetical protein ACFT4A_34145 [Streptomyces sp. NPDC057099]|uniref:hypothetical protein n=1 Tax=Streptomyces sp. NPDC057099 TaxID=3346019 RepID=UPI003644C694